MYLSSQFVNASYLPDRNGISVKKINVFKGLDTLLGNNLQPICSLKFTRIIKLSNQSSRGLAVMHSTQINMVLVRGLTHAIGDVRKGIRS